MEALDTQEQIALTRMIMELLDAWGLDAAQEIALLGLPEKTPKRALRRFRQGTEPFPDSPETRERLEHIVGIAEALRTTFPRNANMRTQWMRQPHRRFGQPPLAVMVDQGLAGLVAVRCTLDCAFAWNTMEA